MIVRAVLEEDFDLDYFDFFNDYKDTKAWLKWGVKRLEGLDSESVVLAETYVRCGKELDAAFLRWSDSERCFRKSGSRY